jgi:hypothetical protein
MELGRPGAILCADATVLVGSMLDAKVDFATERAVDIAAKISRPSQLR